MIIAILVLGVVVLAALAALIITLIKGGDDCGDL